jgi:DNA-binding MarR family transcriptional regulator
MSPRDLIRKVHFRLRSVCDAELQSYGLSFSQFVVLCVVAEHPGASLAGLARCTGMSKQAVHQVLRGLRAASLVAAAEPAQGLDQPVGLTAAGQLLRATATGVVDRAEERMLAGIAARDRDRLTVLLRRCVENLQAPQPSRSTSERGAAGQVTAMRQENRREK